MRRKERASDHVTGRGQDHLRGQVKLTTTKKPSLQCDSVFTLCIRLYAYPRGSVRPAIGAAGRSNGYVTTGYLARPGSVITLGLEAEQQYPLTYLFSVTRFGLALCASVQMQTAQPIGGHLPSM